MDEQVVTEKLAAVLSVFGCLDMQESEDLADLVAALLPVVREIAAGELREAAEAITENGRPDLTTVHQVNAVNEAAQWLDDRADELSPP